jgi:uncharacterized protein with PIN domain
LSVYVESSAVLAWLLDEAGADDIVSALAAADAVYSSELTLVECDRVFIRAVSLGEIAEAEAERRRGELAAAAAHWTTIGVSDEVLSRARRAFPAEPVRTLDALHLASALLVRAATSDLTVLALDGRVRRNGRALGFALAPEGDA